MTLASRLSHSSAIARPSPREAPKIRTVDSVVMRYSDQRADAADAPSARLRCPFELLGDRCDRPRRREDVTAIPLIVAPKCPYTSDQKSIIAMPYDARLLSGVTVLMAVVEAGSMARAAASPALTYSDGGRPRARLARRGP